MKKIAIFFLTLGLAATLAACGRRDNANTTPSTSAPTRSTTAPTTEVTILPTLETNIPDPNVDTSMPDMTETTETTNGATGSNHTQDNGGAVSRSMR